MWPVLRAIETKLPAPSVHEAWVERRALVQSLIAAAAARLVLVEAPAGFGKTTLVAQWRASPMECRPFAWVSLGQGDNDPAKTLVVYRARAAASASRRFLISGC